jgi:hypothetical protein
MKYENKQAAIKGEIAAARNGENKKSISVAA